MKIQRLTQNSRLTAAILTAVMTAGCLTGCGGTNDTDAPAAAQTDAAPPETDTTETASSAQESETTQDTDGSEDLTALELSRLMGNGINLGNTMEAYGRPELGINADTSKYETFWGQPVTTEEMIAGYNTNIAKTCDDRFKMPKDTIPDKLLVSVHYYDPWNYCGTDSGTQWGTHGEYETQNADLKKMTKFTEQGYGVIIGEYGVLAKDDGTLKDSITAYTENLLDNCDLYNFVPMLWDTSTFFVRSELTFSDDDLLALYTSRSYAAQEKTSEEELAAAATERMDTALANAPEVFDTSIDVSTLDGSIAWIMFNSRDWSVAYSSGDSYKPDDKAAGLVATDAVIDGAGTYTISLDFTGTDAGFAEGTAFSAIGISNAEVFYPGYMIDIKEIEVNGTPYELTGTPYTTSDNGICTRLNLYNEWVTDIPDTARIMGGNAADAAATVVDNETLGQIKTLKITFDFVAP